MVEMVLLEPPSRNSLDQWKISQSVARNKNCYDGSVVYFPTPANMYQKYDQRIKRQQKQLTKLVL